jgi:O-methyltransferase involved in polyketide biosynthesis
MKKRIQSKTSRTAEFTCTTRCLSYLEKRPQFHTDDSVSWAIMNGLVKPFLRIRPLARWFLDKNVPGMYAYVIARTKYIDEAFQTALRANMEQILILEPDSIRARFVFVTAPRIR